MSNPFGYNPPGRIRNFKWLRCVTYWAAGLGLAQALIWVGLTLTGILSYNCILPAPATITYGSEIQTIFYDLYFKGDCNPPVYQSYVNTLLTSVPIVLQPWQILVWDCVYLGVAVCWVISSALLFTHVKKDDVQSTLIVIYIWVGLTYCVCAMDLALGIIFGIDYNNFHEAALGQNLNSINAGEIDPDAVQLLAGSVVSISMVIISFKGFILWIINIGLTIYLMIKAIYIGGGNDTNDTLFMPREEHDDILTTRPPIKAYEESLTQSIGNTNEAFVPDDRSQVTLELNKDALARAARMSTDASLQDRRFRSIDAFQQYPKPPPQYNPRPESIQEGHVVTATVSVAAFPAPDYSPPMTRANPGQNGQLQNQRYQ